MELFVPSSCNTAGWCTAIMLPNAQAVTSTNKPPSSRLLGLDALRGIAAMCVVLFHMRTVFDAAPQLSPRAYLAVDFFFVLSGFVMARAYEAKLAKGLGGEQFFKIRYLRLWPTIAFGCLLFIPFVLEAAGGFNRAFAKVFVVNMLLLPALDEKEFFPLNLPAWSIFFELLANAVHGFVLWRLGTRTLVTLSGFFLIGLGWQAHTFGNLNLGAGAGEFLAGSMRVGFSYTIGILIWRLWGERQVNALLGWAALIAMPLLFSLPIGGHTSFWLYDLVFVAIVSPLILVGGLAIRGGGWGAIIAGEPSFPLYATHFPMLYIGRSLGLGAASSVIACLAMAGLVTAVQLTWRRHNMR